MNISEIFVSGGLPTITYNPRANLKLEETLLGHLKRGYHLISITGPTKSGKTVLCTKALPLGKYISISGGQLIKNQNFGNKF